MKKFIDFYESFWFLTHHYIFMDYRGYKEICRYFEDPESFTYCVGECIEGKMLKCFDTKIGCKNKNLIRSSLDEVIQLVLECHTHYSDCLCVEVQKVNPETRSIDDNEELNTKVEVWFECGPYHENYCNHDLDLDCGADTYELATIKLANLVYEKYGDNTWDNIDKFFKDKAGITGLFHVNNIEIIGNIHQNQNENNK